MKKSRLGICIISFIISLNIKYALSRLPLTTRDELQYRTNLQVSHNNLQISIFLENEKVKIERERERESRKKKVHRL